MLQLLQKLDLLREKLLAMASLVEKALDGSVRVLADRNEFEARRVLDYEEQINGLEIEVDRIADPAPRLSPTRGEGSAIHYRRHQDQQ